MRTEGEGDRSKRRAGVSRDASPTRKRDAAGDGGLGGMSREFMEQMMKFFSVFQGTRMGGGESYAFGDSRRGLPPKRAVLEEKYFRRVPQFTGDSSKFRSWFFDLVVCIGTVDVELGEELKRFIGRWDRDNKRGVSDQVGPLF